MNIILFSNENRFMRNDDRYQHIRKILKKKEGDTFFAGEINGYEGTATITYCGEDSLQFSFAPEKKCTPLHPIILIVGFPRPIQLKRLLRDAASLGVSAVWLTGTVLGEKSYRDSTLVERGAVNAALFEGCMQAGGSAVPECTVFNSVQDTLLHVPVFSEKDNHRGILMDINADFTSLFATPLAEFSKTEPMYLAIGSERGWADSERLLFRSHGFVSCGLGKRILRTETAVTAAVSIVLAKNEH